MEAERKGSLIVISGFSGVGKGTVVKKLVSDYGYSLSVSATTRSPREGEVDGREYYFKTEAEFKNLIDYNGLIEYAQYVDHYYGTPRKFVEDEMAAGRDVILEIEVQGAMNIKKQYPDAILLFISAENIETLRERLIGRGTETIEVVDKRIRRAKDEAKSMPIYDYIVVNKKDMLDECVATVHAVITAEKCKREKNDAFIEAIQAELAEI